MNEQIDLVKQNKESKSYIEANLLWNLIVVYKGTSNNKLLNFFKSMDFRDENDNKRVVESIHAISNDSYMSLGIWFENEKEMEVYPFYYARVSVWFKQYIDRHISKIEWKEGD